MQTWASWTPQFLQIMTWLCQLLLAHAPAIDPDWFAHWQAILSGNHFAGEYWRGPDGYATWWSDVIDTLLDLVLPFRADH